MGRAKIQRGNKPKRKEKSDKINLSNTSKSQAGHKSPNQKCNMSQTADYPTTYNSVQRISEAWHIPTSIHR